ncbi:hypothetical protein ACIOG4_27730 [Streptomyces microflavus]|uniref:hypothetical protein n=1 Tax=Streptomyces microflavus TaxID=1919 RepID=UPI003801C245
MLGADEFAAIEREFTVEGAALDSAVEEGAHELAAARLNDGELPELDFWDAHDRLHDDADAQASRINGEGVHAQLSFLSEGCGRDALRALLRDLLTPA